MGDWLPTRNRKWNYSLLTGNGNTALAIEDGGCTPSIVYGAHKWRGHGIRQSVKEIIDGLAHLLLPHLRLLLILNGVSADLQEEWGFPPSLSLNVGFSKIFDQGSWIESKFFLPLEIIEVALGHMLKRVELLPAQPRAS